ncbi:uncharacterized protein At3g17950-like [Hibiscus syriacus]|uniref:uncharacterized protein At3g17950-like n=1 Tax=Hibiscus syriacus TaxID=106335 RepID=UPI001923D22E|nr:uncharacterized protein At3g17950-like [Hibiscus syriacus]
MAQREQGWPLGLEPLNARMGLVRNADFSGSISFTTLITASSPSSSCISSSDLDTQSTGSFYHDKSMTLGSLIGISSFIELSRTSTRRRRTQTSREEKKNCKFRTWFFSLCSKLSTDAVDTNIKSQSLGQFLQVERRAAANTCTRNHHHTSVSYGPADFLPLMLTAYSLFVSKTSSRKHL